MSPDLLVDAPFRQLAHAAEQVRLHAENDGPAADAALLQQAQYMRALLETCRRCAASVHDHLEAHGVSVDVVFAVDQLHERTHRFASNISLGLMLGLVPPIAAFFGLPLDVRHITLSSGQLAAAVGSQGFELLRTAPFWWCVAGLATIGTLNVAVSFFLAFRVALRSRGIRLADRSRIHRAIRARMRTKPLSFLLPPA